MGCLLAEGVPGTIRDYALTPYDLINKWTPVVQARRAGAREYANGAVSAWGRLFAEHVHTICKDYSVPLTTLHETLGTFQEQIARDLELLKLVESRRDRQDLGWEETARGVYPQITKIRDRLHPYVILGLKLTFTFPFVPTEEHPTGKNAVRAVIFPLPGVTIPEDAQEQAEEE